MPKKYNIALAVDLGGTNLRVALVHRSGKIEASLQTETNKQAAPEDICKQMAHLCDQLIRQRSYSYKEIEGIGVSLPGFLLKQSETIHFSPNLPQFRNFVVGARLRTMLKAPLVIENDGNCHALGEWWVGAAKGCHHVVSLALGTGVGGGVIINDRLLRGARGAAAELGHIVVEADGISCGCGNRGCLETLISGSVLQNLTKEPLPQQVTSDLAAVLASLCFVFDPEIIVIGGKASRDILPLLPAVHKEMTDRLRNHPAANTPVVIAKHPDEAALLGAAWTIFAMER